MSPSPCFCRRCAAANRTVARKRPASLSTIFPHARRGDQRGSSFFLSCWRPLRPPVSHPNDPSAIKLISGSSPPLYSGGDITFWLGTIRSAAMFFSAGASTVLPRLPAGLTDGRRSVISPARLTLVGLRVPAISGRTRRRCLQCASAISSCPFRPSCSPSPSWGGWARPRQAILGWADRAWFQLRRIVRGPGAIHQERGI